MKILKPHDLKRLNIKQRRVVLERIYDRLYKTALSLIKKHQYCGVQTDGKTGCATCIAYRVHKKQNFCCQGCDHLKNNKCSVNALTCRAHMCSLGLVKNKDARDGLDRLRNHIFRWKFWVFRGTKKQSIESGLNNIKVLVERDSVKNTI